MWSIWHIWYMLHIICSIRYGPCDIAHKYGPCNTAVEFGQSKKTDSLEFKLQYNNLWYQYVNLEYGKMRSRTIESRSSEGRTVFEAANGQVIEFSLTILRKTVWRGAIWSDGPARTHLYLEMWTPICASSYKKLVFRFLLVKISKMPPKHAACAVSNAIKKALAKTDYKCLGSGILLNHWLRKF